MPHKKAHASTFELAVEHPALQSQVRLRKGALLRVSDQSRKKFQSTLADDLDWLTGDTEPAWVKANVTDVEAFVKGPAGDVARARIGMTPVYAEGTGRLIGGEIVRGEWVFLLILTTAAKADLPSGGNSATQAIRDLLLRLRTFDPHDLAGRSTLYAHALDRIMRNELFAWQTFQTLVETYVLVDAAGRPFDALGVGAKDAWTLITFGAARGRDDTAMRFLVKRLNKARGGDWPGTEVGLPVGWRASAEPDRNGLWNLNPVHAGGKDKQQDDRLVRRPEPDPRQRWAVQLVADLFAQPLSYTDIAVRCGQAGMRSKGAEEQDQTLDQLADLTSAGKLLLTPAKIRAYMTGLLAHTETGVTPGQFSPGDGHKLTPRFDGDDLGEVTYDVRVGRPEDDGWDWGVSRQTWRTILETRFLPVGFEPQGWSWDDVDWDWPAILEACQAGEQRKAPTGRRAADRMMRPLSGVVAFHDETSRSALFAKTGTAEPENERYEWRRQELAHARRDQSGQVYAVSSTCGVPVSSWKMRELHAAVADLLESAVLQVLDNGAPLARLLPPPLPAVKADESSQLRRLVEAKRELARRKREDAEGYGLKAARALVRGEQAQADKDEQQEQKLNSEATALEEEANRLEAQVAPLPTVEPAAPTADFGLVATVIGVLRGAYACGPAPRPLHDALERLLRNTMRLREVDAARVELSAVVHLPLADGSVRTVPVQTVLGRSRSRRTVKTTSGRDDGAAEQRAQRNDALRRAYWTDGCSLEELLALARSEDREHWLRAMLEHCPPEVTDSGLRRGLTAHPFGAVRAVVAGEADRLPEPLATLLRDAYTGPGCWQRRYAVNAISDSRLAAVSVLSALPDPTLPVRSQHLAELVGTKVRDITAISAPVTRGGCTLPATLLRPTGWEGKAASLLPPEMRTVALPACPWLDCPSVVADGLCLQPEVVLGTESTLMCRQCERTPTSDVMFEGYGQLITPALPGDWVRCSARGCDRDLGAGPGVLWRWADGGDVQHQGCRHAA